MPPRTSKKTSTPTGAVDWRGDFAYARLSLADGSRPAIPLGKLSPKEARAQTTALAKRAHAEGWVKAPGLTAPGGPGETVAAWFLRWADHRDCKRGLTSVQDDRSRFAHHIAPLLGPKVMATVGRDDVEAVVRSLDEKVRLEQLSWKTALNVWMLLHRMFRDACRSKQVDLRVREEDPTGNVEPPDRGGTKAKSYLYPVEFLQLAACAEVPLFWRRLYALGQYTGLRVGELQALTWADVDFTGGFLNVERSMDRQRGGEKETKTKTPRRVPIEPTLRPLLEAMHHEAKGQGRVTHVPVSKVALRLREHLQKAGVRREALFASGRQRVALRFHDLRGGCATWMALRGDPPLVIQQALGHEHFSTTELYIREARALGQQVGVPFSPLPVGVMGPLLSKPAVKVPPDDGFFGTKDGAGNGIRILEIGPNQPFFEGFEGVTPSKQTDLGGISGGFDTPLWHHPRAGPGPPLAPRERLIVSLSVALCDALLAGDRGAAQTLMATLAHMLPPPDPPPRRG